MIHVKFKNSDLSPSEGERRTALDRGYQNFLRDLRQALGDINVGHPHQRLEGRWFLPRQTSPIEHINVLLERGDSQEAIMLKIRRDNAYLISYQGQGTEINGVWNTFPFEYVPEGIPEPPALNSQMIPFRGGYDALAQAAGKRVEDTLLGAAKLDNAISALANPTVQKREGEVAVALMVVIQMVCEAARFSKVAQEIARAYRHREEVKTGKTIEYYRAWGHLCGVLNSHIPQELQPGYPDWDMEIPIIYCNADTVRKVAETVCLVKYEV